MTDQIEEMNELGIPSVILTITDDVLQSIAEGKFTLVFGAAEDFLNAQFQHILKDEDAALHKCVSLIVVDECHTVETWGIGKKGRKNTYAFREKYAELSTLRSLCKEGTPLLALTGTANKKTIKNIAKMLAVQKEHLLINVSPARSNIRFSVKCTKREKELGELAWLVTMLKENGLATPKTIIFCGTMKDMSAVYGELMSKLGEAAYVANKPRSPQNRLIGIYHSMTWKKYKSRVFESFKEDNGNIRVVLASSALSMGVNFPDVKYVIHMGPARTVVDHIQEAGRAGRNGELAHNIIVYHGNKIAECEKAIKQFVQSQDCLRKALYKQFDENIQSTTPPHDCCSVCSKACTCSGDKCAAAILPFEMCIEPQGNVVQALTRTVDEEEKSTLYNALKEYQGSLSSGSALLFDSNSTHGFSDELILDITKNCPSIFTIDDVQSKLPVFSLEHAKNILIIMQEIFEDIPLWHDFPESMDIIQDMFNDTSCDIFSEYFDLSSDNEDPDVNNTDELENL